MIRLSDHLPADGSDARPALQALLDAHPGEAFDVDGDYRLTSRASRYSVLLLGSGHRLVGAGRLSYAQAEDPAHSAGETLRLLCSRRDAAGIEVRGIRVAHIVEEIPRKQSHALFFYDGAVDVVIEGVTVEQCGGGDGIYFGDGTSRVRVEDCTVRNFMRHGIVVAGGGLGRSDILIRNNATESDPGYAHRYRPGVNVETTNREATIDRVRIVGNRCEGSIGANYTRGVIAGNRCASMSLSRSQGVLVAHNVIRYSNATGWAVRLIRYQDAELRDNVVETSANGVHVEGIANGGVPWGDVYPGARLEGGGNRVLLRNPAGVPFRRYRRDPADVLESPEVWEVAP